MRSLLLLRPPSRARGEIRRRLRCLLPKKMPWLQGVQPQGGTLHVRRLRNRKGAAKRSHVPGKVLARSPRRRAKIAPQRLHDETPRCFQWRRVVTRKNKFSTSKGRRWPRRAASPSPSSCATSHGQASSSLTSLPAMMAQRTPRSFCSSTSWAS